MQRQREVLLCMRDVSALRVNGSDVVPRGGIVGAGSNAAVVGGDGEVAESDRLVRLASCGVQGAQFLLQLDQRPLAKGVVAGRHECELPPVLDERGVVISPQVMDVAEACVRTDDQPRALRMLRSAFKRH